MEYSATAKYIRTSPRKLRLVAKSMKLGGLVMDALVRLGAASQRAAGPLETALKSAVAGARQKNVSVDTLRIKKIEVMGGPVMKRFHAVSRGTAHGYKKRMTHVKVILTDETQGNIKQISKSMNDKSANE